MFQPSDYNFTENENFTKKFGSSPPGMVTNRRVPDNEWSLIAQSYPVKHIF